MKFVYVWENCDGEGTSYVSEKAYDTEDEAKKALQDMIDEVESDHVSITWNANSPMDGKADYGMGTVCDVRIQGVKV